MKLLRVFCGPMCAAKTTGALHASRRYARHGLKVILIRPAKSRRPHEPSSQRLSTQNGETFPCFNMDHAEDIYKVVDGVDVVWIDEPNHFDDEQKLVEIIPVIRKNSIILISGLGATSELEAFGHSMPYLLAVADHVHWLKADCDACGTHNTATRSLYVGTTPKNSKVKVGGAESYRPVCPECWTTLSELEPANRRACLKVS